MTGVLARAAWLLPATFSLLLFWPGIQCWFVQDDFAWLGLALEVHSFRDLLRALFEPKAQGTIRPWSERAFFMGLFTAFGLDALPFRITVFATYVIDLWLLFRLCLRLKPSVFAAALACLFWGINHGLAVPLSWSSSYNQVLCAGFLMGALLLFIRFAQSGRWHDLALCWLVFVLGFGALEINVVFPALAGAYALFYKRAALRHTVPLFGVSALYTLVHNHFAPKVQAGPYAMHWDPASVLSTLGRYLYNAPGGSRLSELSLPTAFITLGAVVPSVLGLILLLYIAFRLRRHDLSVLFGPAFFLIVIGPVLPLRDHFSIYYLTLPVIGLAILGGQACADAWRSHWSVRAAGVLLGVLYIATAVPITRETVVFNRTRSRDVRTLVYGVERARQLHPKSLILLTDVTSDLFWAGILDKPFRLLNIDDVFLAPGSEDRIDVHPELGDVAAFVLPEAQTRQALAEGRVVVYSFTRTNLRNVTSLWSAIAQSRLSSGLANRVDAGNPVFASQLGTGWYPAENGYRWMAQEAVVYLSGPPSAGHVLHLSGFCPAGQLLQGPLHLTASVNGSALPAFEIAQPDAPFDRSLPLPAAAIGQARLEIRLSLDRAISPGGENRPLGVAFGSISIR